MAKVQAPFFGLDASGTLDKTLTFTSHPGMHRAIKIPTHPDAQSLRQLYQRWRYYDAIQYWNSLTPVQKATYHTTAVRRGLPDMAYFLSIYLKNPIDQFLWLRLDQENPATFPDYSGKGHHATRFGTTPITGAIDGAQHYDGSADRIDIAHHSDLDLGTADFTFMLWILTTWSAGLAHFAGKNAAGRPAYSYSLEGDQIRFSMFDAGVGTVKLSQPWTAVNDGLLHHLAAKRSGTVVYLLIDGEVVDSDMCNFDLDNPEVFRLGASVTPSWWYLGDEDDARLYKRALTNPHIKYIATQERYPLL
ncbi:hypothetical protein ES703_37182 [subsurface metagenome]